MHYVSSSLSCQLCNGDASVFFQADCYADRMYHAFCTARKPFLLLFIISHLPFEEEFEVYAGPGGSRDGGGGGSGSSSGSVNSTHLIEAGATTRRRTVLTR